jgi:hypothetical protein
MATPSTALPRLPRGPRARGPATLGRARRGTGWRRGTGSASAAVVAYHAHRWLRADVRDAIRLELRPSPRPAAGDVNTELRDSLETWAAMLRRARASVIVRRHMTAALGLVIVAEVVCVLLGDDRRAWWLLAPLALGLVDGAIALRRPVALDTVAQMLDRRLALHDRLVTAREILGADAQPVGLGALVVEEARAAAAASFATVRLTASRRRLEWTWLSAAVAMLVVLAAVPGLGARGSTHRAIAPASRPPATAPTRAHPKPAVAAGSARRAAVRAARGSHLARPPLAVTTEGSPQPKHSGFSPYGYGGKSLSAQQLAREGIARPPSESTKALGALAVGESGSQGAGSEASSSTTAGGGPGGKAASGATGSTPVSHGGASVSAGGALTPATSRTGSATKVGGTKQAGAGAGGVGSGSSPPGGSAAGSAPGSTALANGLVPVLGAGTTGLPLQAGYAPSSTSRSSAGEGVSQTPNGGGSGGRSAHASAGAGSSVSSSLSVIPPTFNSTPPLEQGVLSSYFGSANQLVPSDW